MLGDHQADPGDLEDLAAICVENHGALQARAARGACGRCVVDHVVGVGHVVQVIARGTGLLALLPRRCPTFGPAWSRRLRDLGRGRNRGVVGVPAETLLEIGNPVLQLDDNEAHLCDRGAQLGVLGNQLLVGRSVRGGIACRYSPRYERRSRRWWTRVSGGLNSHLRVLHLTGVVQVSGPPR